jgi:hypothetical protein
MAIPTITSVTPNTGPSGGGTTVSVGGSNFFGANKVAFGDASASFTVNSPNSLTAFSPPHVPGTVDVRVSNADGTSAPGSGDLYFYTGSAPTVTGVSPSQGPTAGGITVTLTGSGFLNATGVSFGSATATFTVNSDSQITAFSPPGAGGTVDVQVTNAVGTSAPAPPDRFTYLAIAPAVTGLSTNSGPAAGGTTVTITGTNFLSATAVTFGDAAAPQPQPGPAAQKPPGQAAPAVGTSASFVILSPTQITAFSPPHAAGTVHVRVTTSDGTSAPTAADHFTYQ